MTRPALGQSATAAVQQAIASAGGPYGKAQQGGQEWYTAIASGGAAAALNLNLGNVFSVTLDNVTCAISITNVPTIANRIASIVVLLTQDAVGGRLVTWPAGTKWPGAAAPTLTIAPNALDIVSLFTRDNGATWIGNPGLIDVR